ncbi:MAG: hypothetical protein R3B47_01465 [Bacteroidia bacterium]
MQKSAVAFVHRSKFESNHYYTGAGTIRRKAVLGFLPEAALVDHWFQ